MAVNLTCGVTGRGTEILSVRWKNSPASNRGILVEDGQVMLVTQMHKSVAIMDDLKVYPNRIY